MKASNSPTANVFCAPESVRHFTYTTNAVGSVSPRYRALFSPHSASLGKAITVRRFWFVSGQSHDKGFFQYFVSRLFARIKYQGDPTPRVPYDAVCGRGMLYRWQRTAVIFTEEVA